MSRIVRYEFLGSWGIFWLLCISGFLIPLALLYLIRGTLRVETELENPEAFIAAYRTGSINRQGVL